MKPSRLFWGVLFVLFGTLLLIGRGFTIDFGFDFIWRFWPVAFILLGLAVIFKDQRLKGILAAIAAACLAILLHGLVSFEWLSPHFRIEAGDEEEGERGAHVQEFFEPLPSEATRASFRLDAAAGTYVIDTSSDGLMRAKVRSSLGEFSLDRESGDDGVHLHLRPAQHVRIKTLKHIANKAEIGLSPHTEWDLDLDIGAAHVECDLTKLRVARLDVDAGAATVKLKLGIAPDELHMKLNAGASTVRIAVPEEAGCEVRVDGGLLSKHLVEFDKVSDHIYQTANFNQARKKIFIDADAGVSSLRVVRY